MNPGPDCIEAVSDTTRFTQHVPPIEDTEEKEKKGRCEGTYSGVCLKSKREFSRKESKHSSDNCTPRELNLIDEAWQ